MFETIATGMKGVFKRMSGRGVLSERDVDAALADIRRVLLDADAGLEPVNRLIAAIRPRAVGHEVVRAIKPSEQMLRIVHDGLIDMLGRDPPPALKIDTAPALIMMVGLQGSGKTTSAAKLGLFLHRTHGKKILLASLDTYRPAAMDQLQTLAESADLDCLPILTGQPPAGIAARARKAASLGGYDVAILDTAGRVTLDESMMHEAENLAAIASPSETLLVADALTGQDAVTTAKTFHQRLPLTGIILSRADGDGRAGAALSARAITGLPIRFTGIGEKLSDFEVFDARRMAGRILGQADIVSMVERVSDEESRESNARAAAQLEKGVFGLDDMIAQFRTMQKMGGVSGMIAMLGGSSHMRKGLQAQGFDTESLAAYEAALSSMTRRERAQPKILNASRKRRIAGGAGIHVVQINRMLKMHRRMSDAGRKLGRRGMAALGKQFAGGS